MEYQERTLQRIYSVRFSAGDRIIEDIEKLAREKNIRRAAILFLGAFSKGSFVSGFRKYSRAPVDLNPFSFNDPHEVVGVGSIAWVNDKPKIHLQAGVAKEREVFIAHVEECDVAGIEAFVLEFSGA